MAFARGNVSCFVVFLIYFLIFHVEVHSKQNPKKTLQLMGFFPLLKSPAQAMYDHGNKSRRSAELALEHVNAREDVLRDYSLEMVVCDSGVSTLTDECIWSGPN